VGDRLTEEEQPKQTSPYPYGDIFDEMFPHYLLMGMTPEQYWDGEYGLKRAYRKSYQMRMENEQKLADRNNWYMGQYMICVLQCVPLLVSGLNVKSSTRLPDYPDKPLFEKFEADRKEEDRRKREEDQMKLAMAMFQSVVMQKNKTIESKPKSGSAGQ
jgi:hypothetical protein